MLLKKVWCELGGGVCWVCLYGLTAVFAVYGVGVVFCSTLATKDSVKGWCWVVGLCVIVVVWWLLGF